MNREEWLTNAVAELDPHLKDSGIDIPENLRISCGFPGGGSAKKRIGECWASKAAADGSVNVFINPILDEPVKVLGTLVHELIHAADDCKSGHRGPFIRMARAVGLTGKWTATVPDEGLTLILEDIAWDLGEYPHSALTLTEKVKTQTTRMIKLQADCCGYIVRTTQKWIDEGFPSCPCGTMMERAD